MFADAWGFSKAGLQGLMGTVMYSRARGAQGRATVPVWHMKGGEREC